MKCPHCNMEWADRPGVTDSLKNCPFCSGSLAKKEKKTETLEDALTLIFQQFGIDPFQNGKTLISLHSDLCPDRNRDRRLLTLLMLGEGNVFLLDALKKPKGEQGIAISRLASKLENDWMIKPEAVREVCSAFWLTAGGSQDALKGIQHEVPAKAAPAQVTPPASGKPAKPTTPKAPAASKASARKAPANAVCRMTDYKIRNGVLEKYTGSDPVIAVPQGVTSIGKRAFEGTSVRSVYLPEGIESIGENAFNMCRQLEFVSLPDSLHFIDWYAFFSCESLKTIEIPGKCTHTGMYAFAFCSALQQVTLCNGVTHIDSNTFWNCSALTKIFLPGTLQDVDANSFLSCNRIQVIASEGWKKAHSHLLRFIP